MIIVTLVLTTVASLAKSAKDPEAVEDQVPADVDETPGADWKD